MKRPIQQYFIPHKGNDYRPHILQKAAMLAMLFLVVLSFTVANLQAFFWMSSSWMVGTVLPAVVISETNDERANDNLSQLQRNPLLDQAAQQKAEDMANNGYFAHYSPEGVSPWFWFGQVDYGFVHAGENLAVHFTDSDEVVEAWMNSPSHRENILDGDFQEIGIGVAKGEYEGYDTVFVVQFFGTPAAATTVVAEEPAAPTPVVAAESATSPPAAESPSEPPAAESLAVAGAEDQVTLTETREQEPVVVATEVSEETSAAPTTTPTTTAVTQVQNEEEPSAVYSNFLSTTTGGVPASVKPGGSGTETSKPFFAFTTQPQFVLQALYAILGVFVVGALLMSILIEIRRQEPVQIAYGVALLGLMYGLYTLHVTVTAGAIIV